MYTYILYACIHFIHNLKAKKNKQIQCVLLSILYIDNV